MDKTEDDTVKEAAGSTPNHVSEALPEGQGVFSLPIHPLLRKGRKFLAHY